MSITENIIRFKEMLPPRVRMIAVSKLKPEEDVKEAYAAGQRAFGENYATELRDKHASLPEDIEWHFIGHLQGKQLKYYIPFVHLIHGVDSMEHLQEVERAAAKAGRTVDVLLQVHVAYEETKFGFLPVELEQMGESLRPGQSDHVRVCGIMAMASHTDDITRVRADFHNARRIFEKLRKGVFSDVDCFRELSMGMSHDWPIAVDEGSTMVRIGTGIFGTRDYSKKIS